MKGYAQDGLVVEDKTKNSGAAVAGDLFGSVGTDFKGSLTFSVQDCVVYVPGLRFTGLPD